MADSDEGASLGVWIGLSIIAAVSFYCQAAVTEERFVPALNVVAIKFNIPDDVAGATLMAAGASSPELFSSIVSLFITHSALGLGTIVGSEIFNQLVICAGAVFSAKSGCLKLDPSILIREVGFYALSIGLLLYALRDKEPADDDELGGDHIFVNFSEAALLAGTYVLYVIVCANFQPIVDFVSSRGRGSRLKESGSSYGSFGSKSKRGSFHMPEGEPFVHKSFKCEPSKNFETQASLLSTQESGTLTSSKRSTLKSTIDAAKGLFSPTGSFLAQTLHLRSSSQSADSVHLFNYQIRTEKPSDHHSLYDTEVNTFSETLNCFLWQRSVFYTKALFCQHGWHLRWFTFTHSNVYSVPDKAESNRHIMNLPPFTSLEIDPDRLILKIPNPVEGKRDYYLLAPSRDIFDAVVDKCESIIDAREDKEGRQPIPQESRPGDVESGGDDDHTSLIEFPISGSLVDILFHILLFPLKALMHFTIPDVRHLDSEGNPVGGLGRAFMAILMCLVWLIIGSYAMVRSLEELADLMNIPDAVVGVTVSAAGTSLPNYVASRVAAQQGFGNMAVSNAFGSNTFNILVGLGWPWTLYIAFANNFQPYHGLRNDGILESVIILATVLLVFIIIMLTSKCTLYPWHGTFFLILYVAYLAFAIGQVYL
jgi:K+-dependent Na+/Ca+ exchanger-like protein